MQSKSDAAETAEPQLQPGFLIGKTLALRSEAVNYSVQDRTNHRKRFLTRETSLSDEETERVKYFAVLAQEYAASPSRLSHGTIAGKFVRLTKMRGKYYRFMGFMQNGEPHLHPLEAVYLAESNKLQVWNGGLPMSIQQMYEQLLTKETYAHYLAYVRLSRLGFMLRVRSVLQENLRYENIAKCTNQLFLSTIPLSLCHAPSTSEFKSEKKGDPSNRCVTSSNFEPILKTNTRLSSRKLMENLQTVVKTDDLQNLAHHGPHNLLFDAYGHTGAEKESTVHFSKRSPISPDFLVSVSHPEQAYPDLSREDLSAINVDCATEVVHCIVDGSDVFFHSVQPFHVPILLPDYMATHPF